MTNSNFFVPELGIEQINLLLQDSRLILPSFNSVGNIGQLTIDLLIHNHKNNISRIGRVVTSLVEPIVAIDGDDIVTALEVYYMRDTRTTILQARSPVKTLYGKLFCKQLVEWVNSSKFKDVLIISGIDATRRQDVDINGPLLKYYMQGTFSHDANVSRLIGSNCESIETIQPGAGLLRILAQQLKEVGQEEVDILVMSYWASEGDNVETAINAYGNLLPYLGQTPKEGSIKLNLPDSWSRLYGNDLNDSSLSSIY